VDADGESEVFYGTGARDSVPGTLFCVDGNGDERWRFTGGFRDDQPRPFELTNTFNASGPFVRDLDHDGFSEVLAVFNHAPYYAGQLALLTVDGTYVSSFWNRGHFFAASLGSDLRAMAFADIDHDGLDEILAGGSNNGTNTAVLAILDPRAVRGVGPRSLADTLNAAWQSYIVFPACPPLEQTAGTIARLGIGTVQNVRWEGQPVIRAESKGWLPDTSWVGFTYHLDYDLQLVFFNMDDQTKKWIRRARAQGLTDADVDSPEFWRMMTDIRVIPGDPRLLLPPGEPGARDAAVATRRDGTQRGGAIP
ncbi:MAG: hypothetical protein MUE60_11640, partial [Candidatus Eisenbacteria bacterium]|nr:hypothetical protein [Candidatus Eisenbacteria bacterium]